MAAVRHKWFGTAQIIRREGDLIVIQYDKTGTKSNLKFPDSFITKPCLFVLDAELQREVDAIVEARKEEARILRAEKEAQRAQEKAVQNVVGTNHSHKKPAKVKIKGMIEQSFEEYLIASGYSEETPSGAPSTVNAYIKAVEYVMEEEKLAWQSLTTQISSVVSLYDIGGAKEEIGSKSNYTYINALRRFEDFVNNSTP
jgi:hypothetical protein